MECELTFVMFVMKIIGNKKNNLKIFSTPQKSYGVANVYLHHQKNKIYPILTILIKKPTKMAKKEKKEEQELPNGAEDKRKALFTTMAKLDKEFGKGSVMMMSDKKVMDIDVIPTGSLSLDLALGVGGIPRGRVIEIYGPESSGKTTLAIHCMVQAQKLGGFVAFIDAEHAFDSAYAQALGIDTSRIILSQPDNGEQALEIADNLIRSGAIDLVVIDSVAALVPRAEIEGEMGDSKMGLHARLMSQALRKLTGSISKTNCSCIFINQLRDKIGVMFGSPETTTGGNALKYYASVRLDIRRIGGAAGQLKDGEDIIGNRTRVKVVKNKVAPPFKVVEFEILYGKGISRFGEILELGVELEVITKSGTSYYFKDVKIAVGKEKLRTALEQNPELTADIEATLVAKIKSGDISIKEVSAAELGDDAKEEPEPTDE